MVIEEIYEKYIKWVKLDGKFDSNRDSKELKDLIGKKKNN